MSNEDRKLAPAYMTRGEHVVYPVEVDSNGVTGVISVTFLEHGSVCVRTVAHINDDLEAISYRGESWLANDRLTVDSKGQWTSTSAGHSRVTRRNTWSDAPPTYEAKILEAIRKAAQDAYASNPDAIDAGERREAQFELDAARRELAELELKIKEARKALRKAERRVAEAE